ncbi:SDR family NAD(P)-dependent oxidoreductase [Cohnella nanjingensis]|uniref:SDR family oxidoreductase n=1 Tax=Cohnella nanjingensis TaxID=1387779 RepID=A0A7X0RQ66_9BACL|nr:SDR family oxidoreductase [Cohnella nanjingensis]MBB6671654.1 SDR family oxidoreductase [Cohnella nanjingensis]
MLPVDRKDRRGKSLKPLDGKVILVTGCLGTAGRSAVTMFLRKGAVVFGCDRRPIDGSLEKEAARAAGGKERFAYRQADLCEEEEVMGVMTELDRRFERLDGTYHNVYTNVWKPALELTLPEWDETIRGTLTSTFLVCKHALPLLIRSGGGSIVNASSILGQLVQPGCLAYGAAKAGVNQLTRVLAADYAAYGIRANALVPGDFKPDEALARQSGQEKEAMRRHSWLGRSGRADEINEVAAFLLSDAAAYVTGALYTVDGGFHV